jgi:hypothetical protein
VTPAPTPRREDQPSSARRHDERDDTLAIDDDGHDPRFTLGLLLEVIEVIQRRGYDLDVTGRLCTELQLHLFHFLHGDTDAECQGGTA